MAKIMGENGSLRSECTLADVVILDLAERRVSIGHGDAGSR